MSKNETPYPSGAKGGATLEEWPKVKGYEEKGQAKASLSQGLGLALPATVAFLSSLVSESMATTQSA